MNITFLGNWVSLRGPMEILNILGVWTPPLHAYIVLLSLIKHFSDVYWKHTGIVISVCIVSLPHHLSHVTTFHFMIF